MKFIYVVSIFLFVQVPDAWRTITQYVTLWKWSSNVQEYAIYREILKINKTIFGKFHRSHISPFNSFNHIFKISYSQLTYLCPHTACVVLDPVSSLLTIWQFIFQSNEIHLIDESKQLCITIIIINMDHICVWIKWAVTDESTFCCNVHPNE